MSEPGNLGVGLARPLPGRPGGTNCPFGHGLMESLEGWWALTGMDVTRATPSRLGDDPAIPEVTRNQRAYVLKAWRCPVCGNVQLFDSAVA